MTNCLALQLYNMTLQIFLDPHQLLRLEIKDTSLVLAGAKEKETLRFKSRQCVIIIPREDPSTEWEPDELQKKTEDWRQVWHPGRIKSLWCGKRVIFPFLKLLNFILFTLIQESVR